MTTICLRKGSLNRFAAVIRSGGLAWAIAFGVAALPAARADNGEGFFSFRLTTGTQVLNTSAVDPTTLLPLPATFNANSAGEYSLSALLVLDGDTSNPIGELNITGLGDPEVQTNLSLHMPACDDCDEGSDEFRMFASIIAGVGIFPVKPMSEPGGQDWQADTTLSSVIVGTAGSPPASVLTSVRTFLRTLDDMETVLPGAEISSFAALPGMTNLASLTVDLPPIPASSGSSEFGVLLIQHDIAVFDIAEDTDFGIDSTGRTVVALPPNTLPGDYNQDGMVNLADYPKWRDNLGASAGTLPNDSDGGLIGPAQYDTWKANYGDTISRRAALTIPEPSAGTAAVLGLAGLMLSGIRRRRG